MCFPKIEMPKLSAFRPPSLDSASTQKRMQDATRIQPGMTSILTSALGDPEFGRNINRTVLTGALTS